MLAVCAAQAAVAWQEEIHALRRAEGMRALRPEVDEYETLLACKRSGACTRPGMVTCCYRCQPTGDECVWEPSSCMWCARMWCAHGSGMPNDRYVHRGVACACAAWWSGVWPSEAGALTRASSAAHESRTRSSSACPELAARCSAVQPLEASRTVTSTPVTHARRRPWHQGAPQLVWQGSPHLS